MSLINNIYNRNNLYIHLYDEMYKEATLEERSSYDCYEREYRELLLTLSFNFKRDRKGKLVRDDNNIIKKVLSQKKLSKFIMDIKKNPWERLNEEEDNFELFKDYNVISIKDKKKYAEIFTSLSIVNRMLDKYDNSIWSNKNIKWLEPSNGTGNFLWAIIKRLYFGLKNEILDDRTRYKYIVENMIYACEIQPKNMWLWLNRIDPNNEFSLKFCTGNFLKFNTKIWGSNFYSISNPPFNQSIDMLFLKKLYDISDNIMFVHPSTWLLDEKEIQKKFTSTKELISKHLDSIEFFNGNKIFDVNLFVPCVITHIDKFKITKGIKCIDEVNNIEIVYNNIWDINKFSNTDIYFTIKNKILNYIKGKENIWNYYQKNKSEKKNYMISFTGIRGNVDKDKIKLILGSFYTIVSVDRVVQKCNEIISDNFLKYYFSTKEEAENFLNYLKTDVVRFMVSIYKNNQNLHRGELSLIPWLDFSKEWTNDDMINELNLTEDEIKFIEKHIPKYYKEENIHGELS